LFIMKVRLAVKIVLKVLPYVLVVIIVKLFVHRSGLEFIPLNAIFSALIGANVFLLGFLISGVLSDYKESERLPGEISTILLTITDEIDYSAKKSGDNVFRKERLNYILRMADDINKWLHKEVRTKEIMAKIESLTNEFYLMEKYSLPNYIARLKQEQNNLRKAITRIHTIRETDFVFSGYFIAATTSFLLIVGMIFLELEPFMESLFFVGIVTYLLVFLLRLIIDLDNPFGHYDTKSFEDVSLKPLEDVVKIIESKLDTESVT
jgi:hypothetical protein